MTFGHYDQDGNAANGAESIEWTVIDVDGNIATLISRYGLDARPYGDGPTGETWETCDLRRWLNDVFLGEAFSEPEQARLETTALKAEPNPIYWTDADGDKSLDGYYDLSTSYGTDTNTSLFLPPAGHGALSTGTGFVTFDFDVSDGDIHIASEGDAIDSMWLTADGCVYVRIGYKEGSFLTIQFERRETSPADAQALDGKWELVGFNEMDDEALMAQGFSTDLTFYSSGALDWCVSTNGASLTVAKDWGKDDDGYYINNGDQISRLSIDGDTMTFSQSSGSENIDYTFARARDYELGLGLFLRQG